MRPQAEHWDTAYEWKAVTLLTLGFGLVGLDRWIITPLLPMMMKDLHLDPQDVGNILGILGIAWGVFAVLTGHLSDRLGRRTVLTPAMIAFSLLSAFSGAVGGLASLLVIRALMGVTEGAFCPTSFAATNDASLPERRGRNQGIQQCTFALFGLGFGPIIATQLLEVVPSWRWVFLLVGVPGLILSAAMWKVIRDRPRTADDSATSTRGAVAQDLATTNASGRIFGHRNVLLGMLAQFCAVMGMFVLAAFMPIYLSSYLKLAPAQMGFVTSALGFGGALGMFGLPTLSDWIGRRPAAVLGFGFGALFVWWFAHVGVQPVMLFVLLFLAATSALGLLTLISGTMAAEAAPVGRIAATIGLISGSGEIFGGGIAPAIAGWMAKHHGLQSPLYLAFAGLAAGLVISLFFRETAPRKLADRNDLAVAQGA